MKLAALTNIKPVSYIKNPIIPYYTNHSPKLPYLNFDSVCFKGNPAFKGTRTNYVVYDKDAKTTKPLIIEPRIDFSQFYREERFFPFLKAYKADFSYGNLSGTYLKGSDLSCSNFNSANLCSAKMHESNLFYSNFANVQASRAKFYKSNMQNTSLCRGDFTQANMQGADFSEVTDEDFHDKGYGTRPDFKDAIFTQANFLDTNLSGVENIETAKFAGAIYNKNTKFPKGFDPVKAYMFRLEPNAVLDGLYLESANIKTGNPLDFDDYRGLSLKNSTLDKTRFMQLDLRNSVFDGASCEKTVFDSCILDDSSFKNCDLERANFQESSLKNVKFYGTKTNLEYANFINADLTGTDIEKLSYFQLKNALFSPGTRLPYGFSLEDARNKGMIYICDDFDFSDKNLSGIKFNSYKFARYDVSNFKNAKFKRCDLHYADFNNTCLVNCAFDKATLKNATLRKANCENASFKMTNMACVDLSGANLKNTDLRGAKMQGAKYDKDTDFMNAVYDQNTVLPENLDAYAHKMIYKKSDTGLI